jgi:2-(1,2-epoxy-1,2-dihydrophenyl)acetyl-CoA isomerase
MALDYQSSAGVAVVTLSRPEVLNAFDDELGGQLVEAVEQASLDDAVRCIVITGAGRAFSAGEDLAPLAGDYVAGRAPDLGDTLIKRYNPLIRAVTGAPKPVVAAINGVAAGAGASLALACDYRVASERAKLMLAFIKVGLIPDSGALWFLANMVGVSRAWQLAASGDPLSAQQAFDLGIVHRVVAPEEFEARWREWAMELAQGPTRAFGITKTLLYGATERSLSDQLELEISGQSEAGKTRDHLEGVQAFFDKRPPKFEGR